MTIKETYQHNSDEYSRQLKQLTYTLHWVSFFRLAAFIATLVLFIYFIDIRSYTGLIIPSVCLVAFIILVALHQKKSRKKSFISRLLQINREEFDFLNHEYLQYPTGEEFMDTDHPFAFDLDIFGKASLFQYINRTATSLGSNRLGYFLKNPLLDKDTIISRQAAINELSKKINWRQRFRAIGDLHSVNLQDKQKLTQWADSPQRYLRKKVLRGLLVILPGALIITGTFSLLGSIPWIIPVLILFANYSLLWYHQKNIRDNYQLLSETGNIMKKYASLLKAIEEENFQSDKLRELQNKLFSSQIPASKQIHQLSRIVNSFDLRLNLIGGFIVNSLYMNDIQCIIRLEKWRKRHGRNITDWLNTIAEMDALSSFANFSFNNADNACFPECQTEKFTLQAKETGHPLIPDDKRVTNNFSIDNFHTYAIITGANMAGKSTFLRTTGVNLLLAMTGAPVIAKEFYFYPVLIRSRINIKDSLYSNESYFFAELKRLKGIIDELENGYEIFVLLDEILRGTNSEDKHTGSQKFLEKIIRYKVSGIIATHDIALGKLEKKLPDNITNYCFEVELENNQLIFDYKLRNGISNKLNASFLMNSMNIID